MTGSTPSNRDCSDAAIGRRHLLSTVGASVGTGLLAGCADSGGSDGSGDSEGSSDAPNGTDAAGTDGDGGSGGEDHGASISARDQSGFGSYVVVDEASATVEYHVTITYDDSETWSDDFDAGTTQTDLRMDLGVPVGETYDVTVAILDWVSHEELASETIEYEARQLPPPGDAGPPDPVEWELAFEDEFDEGRLDAEVWSSGFGEAPLDCPAHEGPSICAVEDYAYVDPQTDRLVLEASEDTPTVPTDQEVVPESPPQYSVGAVASEGGFEQEFGYFEIKSRVPTERGTLPAAWFYIDTEQHDWREPHLYEKRGAEPHDQVQMAAGWADDTSFEPNYGASAGDDGAVRTGRPTGEVFNVYGLEWRPDSLTWYVNGEEVGTSSDPAIEEHLAGEPVYWIINHSVFDGADWVGYPEDAEFPSYHEVEWVRAYRHEDHEEWVAES